MGPTHHGPRHTLHRSPHHHPHLFSDDDSDDSNISSPSTNLDLSPRAIRTSRGQTPARSKAIKGVGRSKDGEQSTVTVEPIYGQFAFLLFSHIDRDWN